MPNRLYNKQVTPKGYEKGGKVRSMKKDPIADYVRSVKEIKKPKGTKRLGKMGGGMMMMERPMMKEGGPSKKPKVKKIAIGTGKAKDYPGIKKIMEMNKKGRKRFKAGGALKPVDPKTQKGLSKLPTKVRNKMGYMKKGVKVNGK
jgi:hypothetical protein